MNRSLPLNPSLVQLRKQAKEILKARDQGRPGPCQVLRELPRLADVPDEQLLTARVTLADVQFALARAHGFESWKALKDHVQPPASVETVSDHLDPFSEQGGRAPAQVRRDGGRTWLEPIPRFPLKVRLHRTDPAGVVEKVGPRGTVPALWHGMRMLGGELPYLCVEAAAGEAFRFTFSEDWNHDAQRISPVDALERACRTLGFEGELVSGSDAGEVLDAVEGAVGQGQPVLLGTNPIYWHLVVGWDGDGSLLCVGGDPGREGVWDFLDVRDDEPVDPTLPVDACKRIPRPEDGWVAVYPGPQQVVHNAGFILRGRREVSPSEIIRQTLTTCLELHRFGRQKRTGQELRRQARDLGHHWPSMRGEGDYVVGLAGLRAWADAVEALSGPTHDDKYIEGHDIFLGEQLQYVESAVRFLQWAMGRCDDPARGHLAAAHDLFEEANRLAAWGTARQPMVDFTCDDETADDIRRHLAEHASMIYIVDREKKALLDELGLDHGQCWLGLTVLPDRATFEAARDRAVGNIRKIADVRERACREAEQALASMA